MGINTSMDSQSVKTCNYLERILLKQKNILAYSKKLIKHLTVIVQIPFPYLLISFHIFCFLRSSCSSLHVLMYVCPVLSLFRSNRKCNTDQTSDFVQNSVLQVTTSTLPLSLSSSSSL